MHLMSQEDRSKRQFELGRAREISAMLDSEVIKATINGIIHGIQNEWMNTMDREQREFLWQQGQGVHKFVATLQGLVDTGKLAAEQLRADDKLRSTEDAK